MKILSKIALTAALAALSTTALAQTTYTWDALVPASYADSASWSPARTTPATDDILTFPAGNHTVTSLPGTQTIGKLILAPSTTVTLYPTTASTIRLGAAASDVLQIPASSALIFSATTASTSVTVRTDTSASSATIQGRITFTADSNIASVAHRLIGVASTDSFIFANGSSFEFAARAGSWGNPFSNVANAVRFQSGATYYQGGTSSGNSPGTGSNPFNTATPCIIMDAGSNFYNWTSVYSTAGRTYGNLEIDNKGSATSPFGTAGNTASTVINGDITWKSTAAAAVNIAAAAPTFDPMMVVSGNFTVEPNGRFNDLYAAAIDSELRVAGNVSIAGPNVTFATGQRIWVLNGSAPQTISIASPLIIYGLKLDNAAGAVLGGNLNVSGSINLANGDLTTGVHTLNLASNTTLTGSGKIYGNISRAVDASVVGIRIFPIGNNHVAFDITSPGTGSGGILASTTAGVGASLPGGSTGIARTWTLTPSGISGFTGTLFFTYSDGELNGATESALKAARWNGSSWDVFSGTSTVDTFNNTVTVTGVTDFSDWTLLEQPASVSEWQMLDQ